MNKTTVAQPAKTVSSLSFTQAMLQRQCACGNHTPAGGECEACAKKKKGMQRKLNIGASNDPLEQEADRVAEQVMTAPLNSVTNAVPPRIQRFTGQSDKGSDTAPASVDRVLESSGRPLEPALQREMGQRFGHDFSQVRVHTGSAAEQSARDVGAKAYTVGNNVVFGAGRFVPGSNEGRRLLAHELTHVIQQGADSDTGFVRPKLLQRSLDTYIKAMQVKPEPDWKTAAEHLNGASPEKIKAILRNLSPHYRAKLHEAALVWPGLCSNIGRFTEADYLKEHPTTTRRAVDICGKQPAPAAAPSTAPAAPTLPPASTAPATPTDCSPSKTQQKADGCTPNPHGKHLPDVGGTHTESHPFEPCLLTQADVAASPKWCVDKQQAHGGEVCYREIPSSSGAKGAQYCYSLNCCHNSADEVSVVKPTSPGSNACCETDVTSLPGHILKDVGPEFLNDPKRVIKDILGL